MTKKRTGIPSLAYMGVEASTPPQLTIAQRAPATSDYYGYNIGHIWIYDNGVVGDEEVYMLIDKAARSSTWLLIAPTAGGDVDEVLGDDNITIDNGEGPIVTVNLDTELINIDRITFSDGASVRTGISDADTLLLQAYDVDGGAYKTFITFTAGDTPTCNLDADVTINGKYIYHADGTNIDVPDGGTGRDTLTDHCVLVGAGTAAITSITAGTDGQLLVGSSGADPVFASVTQGSGIGITEGPGSLTISNETTLNNQVGTAYTLVLTDAFKFITFSNAGAITVTIPTNASVEFPIGTQIGFEQLGAGQVTFSGAGVTLQSALAALTTVRQYSVGYMIKIATDTWVFGGDLEP